MVVCSGSIPLAGISNSFSGLDKSLHPYLLMIKPSLDGYTPEDVRRIASRYFNDVGNEAKRRELQHVADLAAQQQRTIEEQKRNGTYKPNQPWLNHSAGGDGTR